jgi:hypothetical protein
MSQWYRRRWEVSEKAGGGGEVIVCIYLFVCGISVGAFICLSVGKHMRTVANARVRLCENAT